MQTNTAELFDGQCIVKFLPCYWCQIGFFKAACLLIILWLNAHKLQVQCVLACPNLRLMMIQFAPLGALKLQTLRWDKYLSEESKIPFSWQQVSYNPCKKPVDIHTMRWRICTFTKKEKIFVSVCLFTCSRATWQCPKIPFSWHWIKQSYFIKILCKYNYNIIITIFLFYVHKQCLQITFLKSFQACLSFCN